jgi:hypothetical protein
MFIPGYILRIRTNSQIYQFGLNSGAFWKGELPFPVRRERIRLKYSPFSILIRLLWLARSHGLLHLEDLQVTV